VKRASSTSPEPHGHGHEECPSHVTPRVGAWARGCWVASVGPMWRPPRIGFATRATTPTCDARTGILSGAATIIQTCDKRTTCGAGESAKRTRQSAHPTSSDASTLMPMRAPTVPESRGIMHIVWCGGPVVLWSSGPPQMATCDSESAARCPKVGSSSPV